MKTHLAQRLTLLKARSYDQEVTIETINLVIWHGQTSL